MTVHEEKYLEYCAACAVGALDGGDLHEFEDHREAGCTICNAEIALHTEAAALIPLGLQQIHVSGDLKERIMFSAMLAEVARAEIRAQEEKLEEEERLGTEALQAEPGKKVKGRSSWLIVGMILTVIIVFTVIWIYVRSVQSAADDSRERLSAQQSGVEKLVEELENKDAVLKIFASRRLQIFYLASMEMNSQAYGKIFWDAEGRGTVLQVANLPGSPEDMEYELWIFRDQKPESGGLFTVEEKREKKNFFRVQNLDLLDQKSIKGIVVTLEPKGGSEQPTGKIYLFGKVGQDLTK